MINLFAGVGPSGEMRFIGEVERGAACGCRCPECGSPLIAKQGSEKEWHFAHEAGQERPECEAGAMNMLRRLAAEYLRKRERLELPPYRESVQVASPVGIRAETVEWRAQFQGMPEWLPKGPRSAPIARGQLDSGAGAEVFVEIGEQFVAHVFAAEGLAKITFSCPIPAVSDLRDRERAERHLHKHGRLEWRYHPDSLGVVAAARERLKAMVAKDVHEAQVAAASRARDAGRKWAAIGQQLHAAHETHPPHWEEPLQRNPTASVRAPNPDEQFDWAPNRKPNSSFIFYRLKDGSAWVVYTMTDETLAVAPWPKEEGWDEALPRSVGRADETLGVYRCKGGTEVMTYLAPRSVRMRATSNPGEFEGL